VTLDRRPTPTSVPDNFHKLPAELLWLLEITCIGHLHNLSQYNYVRSYKAFGTTLTKLWADVVNSKAAR
jgi:hypothetical protein